MTNITQGVWKIINADASIRRDLSRKIINKLALANYISKKMKIKAPINAIVSAIRRYEEENPVRDVFNQALDVISNSTMSSKNGIVSLTLEKDDEVERLLPKLFSLVEIGKNNVMRIIQADQSVKVVIDKKNLKKAKKIIPAGKIKRVGADLAEVTVHLDGRSWSTPGVAEVLTSELSMSNINIVEIMSCIPEIILFFKEKDLMKAYNVLYGLCNRGKIK